MTSLTPPPACKICGTTVSRFIKSKNAWWSWCSNKCMGQDPEILEKKKATNLKKFGGHPMQNSSIKQQLKNTFIKHFGVDNPSKSAEVKDKMKATFVANYGVNNPSKSAEVKDKIRNKAIDRFQTNKQEILEKRRKTFSDAHGVTTNKHLHLSQESLEKMKDIEWLKTQHYTLNKTFDIIAKELGCSPTPLLLFFTNNGETPRRFGISTTETEILSFLSSFTNEILTSDRSVISPQELDIVLPNIHTAIEVNGVYWHSELLGKNNQYHLSKTTACIAAGYKLIHIFDCEWNYQKDIVKSKLAGLFNQHSKIAGRKCIVKEIDTNTANTFLNENHLQGAHSSKINLGLFYQDALVSVMTFSASRYNQQYQWELIRLCSSKNIVVQGGASKLFRYFINTYDPDSIISYADMRWSTGNVYKQLGFLHLHNANPNYFYFKSANKLESRVKYQKHKIIKQFNVIDTTKTEWEIMQENGYNRIWDCGNMVFIWTKP